MNRQAIIDFLLDHYEQPRNRGPLDDADVVVSGGIPDCGDSVTIYLKVDAAGEAVERISFEGEGCTISQAAASLLTEIMPGKRLDVITAMNPEALIDMLGREVVASRPRCATLAIGTLQTAVVRYRRERTSDQGSGIGE